MKHAVLVCACCVVFAAAAGARQGQGQGQGQGQAQGQQGQAAGQGQGRAGQPGGTAGRGPATLVGEVQNMFNSLKNNITKAADQFPEENYEWSPTPDVRSFGLLLGHIADDNNGACWGLAGDAERPGGLDSDGKPTDNFKGLKKADIVKKLNESFARCDKAFAAVTPENMTERQGARSKIGALIYDTQHISEHYGNIVTYFRLKGLVPPSTAARANGRGRGGN